MDLAEIFPDVPSKTLAFSALDGEGLSLIDALVEVGLVESKGKSRRAIKEGGVYINNVRCEDVEKKMSREDLASETVIVLRRGKKKFALSRFE